MLSLLERKKQEYQKLLKESEQYKKDIGYVELTLEEAMMDFDDLPELTKRRMEKNSWYELGRVMDYTQRLHAMGLEIKRMEGYKLSKYNERFLNRYYEFQKIRDEERARLHGASSGASGAPERPQSRFSDKDGGILTYEKNKS